MGDVTLNSYKLCNVKEKRRFLTEGRMVISGGIWQGRPLA